MSIHIELEVESADFNKVLDYVAAECPMVHVRVNTYGESDAGLFRLPCESNGVAPITETVGNPTTVQTLAPLEPVAASSFVEADEPATVAKPLDEVTEVIEPTPAAVEPARIDIQEVRAAVQQAVKRIDALVTTGNSNSTGHIINKLVEIGGWKKVTDIPFGQYPAVIEGLATLGV